VGCSVPAPFFGRSSRAWCLAVDVLVGAGEGFEAEKQAELPSPKKQPTEMLGR
jgi:hypothetical protein